MAAVRSFSVDALTISVYTNRDVLGDAAARDVAQTMREILSRQRELRMIFAAAPSQNEFLRQLVVESDIDWSRVTVFQMDEYVGLDAGDDRTFGHFLRSHLFNHVGPGKVSTIGPNSSPEEECQRYGGLVVENDIDIVCLGIGENGHIAFNDPPVADFHDAQVMKVVELDVDCRMQQVHDGCFPDFASVPKYAMTLTIPTLMSGKHLFCIVPGQNKQAAVHNTLVGPIAESCPASVLRTHRDCRLYLDSDSYGDVLHG